MGRVRARPLASSLAPHLPCARILARSPQPDAHGGGRRGKGGGMPQTEKRGMPPPPGATRRPPPSHAGEEGGERGRGPRGIARKGRGEVERKSEERKKQRALAFDQPLPNQGLPAFHTDARTRRHPPSVRCKLLYRSTASDAEIRVKKIEADLRFLLFQPPKKKIHPPHSLSPSSPAAWSSGPGTAGTPAPRPPAPPRSTPRQRRPGWLSVGPSSSRR